MGLLSVHAQQEWRFVVRRLILNAFFYIWHLSREILLVIVSSLRGYFRNLSTDCLSSRKDGRTVRPPRVPGTRFRDSD